MPARKKSTLSQAPMSIVSQLQNNSVVLLIIGLITGFALGSLWTQVDMYKKGGIAQAPAAQADAAAQAAPEEPTELKIKKPDPKVDHWKGPETAQFVHVSYSDWECPFCKQYDTTERKLMEEYGDKMAFVFRHFPLPFHPLARPAAEASECVAALGGNAAFWKFHDETFTAMPAVTEASLADLAVKSGIGKAAFTECFTAKKYTAVIDEHMQEAQTAGVGATPTNVIYDMKTGKNTVIAGAYPYDQAKPIIDAFMEAQK